MLPAMMVVEAAQNTQPHRNSSRSLLLWVEAEVLRAKSLFPMKAEHKVEGRGKHMKIFRSIYCLSPKTLEP